MAVAQFPQSDYEKNRIPGGLGYLIFFLPMLLCPDSRYGRFCANQGLLGLLCVCALSLARFIVNLILGWIPIVGPLVGWVFSLARVAVSCVLIYYTYLAIFRNDTRKLPFVEYSFIK